ncbi:uncharacterized protein N7500_009083 [Penicillium coprophilum]|uniref:uncharacterized protein n=1 Tax=Penicillium coprophilum TaxID=36646 RepID=UPI0023845CEA|nr:uncharacterized protein N7500_009083 [Penicillium coprophilum]KAJ5153644.1 hypothetical protein N7500_009083 [Penicillium coprophilum]
MAQESDSMELQPLSQPDSEALIPDKLTTRSELPSRWKCRFLGKKPTENWKKTLYIGSTLTFVVLVFNVGFVLWAVKHNGLHGGQAVLFIGNCKKSKRISTVFHLVINVLGTLLLGASNYGMQCLCAPTRGDIDRAHSRGKWLDVGVQSMRNLWHIPRIKLFLWICLAFSSLPLHLIYNSTIFQTLSVYNYRIFVGSKPFSSFSLDNVTLPDQKTPDTTFSRLLEKDRNGKLERLNNSDCISQYARGFQTNYASLLVVTDDYNSTVQDFGSIGQLSKDPSDPYSWICSAIYSPGQFCTSMVSGLLADPDNWPVQGMIADEVGYEVYADFKVNYCLSESVPERCTVEYSLSLVIVVILSNIIKMVILCWITITMAECPILTTGDAISSFIEIPDHTTRRQCLLSRDMVIKPVNENMRFDAKPRRWGSSVSRRRWVICLLSYFISILVCISLLIIGVLAGGGAPWAVGLGEPNITTMIAGLPSSLLANTIIANLPQAVFSVLYFSSNAIYTIMALTNEWSYHAYKRKGLRVSTLPQGSQRSTYFLSLPYRYSLPLLVFSGILHWLMSQSIYLLSTRSYGTALTREPEGDTFTCGYSPSAIISTISVGVFMLTCLVAIAFKRLKSGMPVAGSCSLAIAAACHPSLADGEESEMEGMARTDGTLPLKWGVEKSEGDGIGHCSLSSEQVELPLDGRVYK